MDERKNINEQTVNETETEKEVGKTSKKKIIGILVSVALILAVFTGGYYNLEIAVRKAENPENIRVTAENGEITGKLYGSSVQNLTIKNVPDKDINSGK